MDIYREYYNKAALKKLGWNEAIIREFNLEPDCSAENPRYPKSGNFMRLFLKSRIHAIMRTKEFKDRAALKRQRSEKIEDGYQAAAKKRADAWVDDPTDDSAWAHLCRYVRDHCKNDNEQAETSIGA